MNPALFEGIVRARWLILLLILAGIVASFFAMRAAPLDAIPDTSDPQVIVYAKWARSPELLEAQVTEPIAKALIGSPDVRSIRATSHMGYSFIYVILKSTSERAAVRQLIADRLATIRQSLPSDATVSIGPNASGIGWIYQYALIDHEKLRDPREMRLLNETQLKPALQAVPGVAEVASVGGLEKQYQLKLFPPLLADAGISLRELTAALRDVLEEAGGRTIEVTNRDYQVRGIVSHHSIDDLEALIVGHAPDGRAIRIKDVGYIQIGYDQRRGIADLNGEGEVVGGIVIMEQSQNALEITAALKKRLAEVAATLPQGIEIATTYDRSQLIWGTLRHFFITLAYELGVVILVTALFLRNIRTSLAPVSILLLGVLFTAIPMALLSQTINLFSLAGLFIAIGEMVDATIVIVENSTAELAARPDAREDEKRQIVLRSIAGVAKPLLFSLLIILASFLPVFFLDEKEARMFDPLAYSKTFAMAFSTLLTLCVLPIAMIWVFKGQVIRGHSSFELKFTDWYRHATQWLVRYRYTFLAVNVVLLVAAVVLLQGFRRDFMPRMEEGSILYMPTTLPGVPMKEAGWVLQQMDKKLAAFPEVASVFGKLGRADTATDAAPVSMIEATISLKDREHWRPNLTKDQLVTEMDAAMQILGYANSWVQPINARTVMQDTGIQTPTGIKVKGPDVATLESIGEQIEQLLRPYPGTQSVIAERISSGYFIDVEFDPQRLAAAGIATQEAMPVVRFGIGGDNLLSIRDESGALIPLSLQYSPEYLDTLEKVRTSPLVAPDGKTVTLGEVADVAVKKMPDMLRNDNGTLAGYVYVYLKGDVTATDYVAGAQAFLAENLALPTGYSIEWTGDYQNAQAAAKRLEIVIPMTLLVIFALLVLAFRSITDSLLIMLSVPFALTGGVFLQWALGYPMTTAVIVGYIALFAVAIQTGIVMIVFIRRALERRTANESYMDAVLDGSVLRLRPKLMTVAVTVLSLLPVMLSSGLGMEIMKPIATPTIGGMLTSTIYVLFLIPCLFAIGEDIRRANERRRR